MTILSKKNNVQSVRIIALKSSEKRITSKDITVMIVRKHSPLTPKENQLPDKLSGLKNGL